MAHCDYNQATKWVEESGNSVILRSPLCQTVSEVRLQGFLGQAYDPNRMSNDDPRKHLNLQELDDSYIFYETNEFINGEFDDFVGNDIGDIISTRQKRNDFDIDQDLEEITEPFFRHGNLNGQFGKAETRKHKEDVINDVQNTDALAVISELQHNEKHHKDALLSGYHQRHQKTKLCHQGSDSDAITPLLNVDAVSQQKRSVKRERRKEVSKKVAMHRNNGDSSRNVLRDKKKQDASLYLRLMVSGKNRDLKRRLKKVVKKNSNKLMKATPPWSCEMKKTWGMLKEDFFPRYLLAGRCESAKCFYRLYDCVPIKYRIKLLKRDPSFCNPLPTLGPNSTYEQKWTVVHYHVTVGCQCQSMSHSLSKLSTNS